MQLTIAQIATSSQALTVEPARDAHRLVNRLSWDSRAIQPGMLFFALPGEKVDGNDFIVEAFTRGAAVVIASRQVNEAERHAAQQHRAALLYAPDGLAALQRLASSYRETLTATVVGITGSTGKTSTKSLVSAVLEKGFLTVSSLGNRNNEIGLPATVLSASTSTEILIVEMAMRGFGQIEDLCQVARPRMGIITNIGPVHLELLGNKENVARAKAELICELPNERGIAILNGDDPYTPFIREVACTAERGIHVVLFGLGAHNDIRASHIDYDAEGRPSFDLMLRDGIPRRVALPLAGRHSIYNALAAAAAGISLNMGADPIVSALEHAHSTPMRQVRHQLENGTLLIDDTYNANPDSMRSALEVLARLNPARLHIAVLGDMGELGEGEAALHEEVGAVVGQTGVDVLVTVGPLASSIAQGARATGMDESCIINCEDIDEALKVLAGYRAQAPIILAKASRFMGFERVVDALMHDRYPDGACAKAPDATTVAASDDSASGGGAPIVDAPDFDMPNNANDREVTAP
ncbi:MAG: UDP-N-acetylmuramoyl-tripeptide--D-alanyl-D-alanine ligase [Coriobacteriales bacterium]|jgi:UDP-N-acetylmuramoyl-tripeptide--D-alanyl-D-alanine ligase|nr:UDP-N-acetylmuramoyl-tripeptide--D-alanyl-D-alanine ligase [Coriobacteriales bacterium]